MFKGQCDGIAICEAIQVLLNNDDSKLRNVGIHVSIFLCHKRVIEMATPVQSSSNGTHETNLQEVRVYLYFV